MQPATTPQAPKPDGRRRQDRLKPTMDKRLAKAAPIIRDLARLNYGAEDIGPKIGRTATTARRYAQALGITLPNNGRKIFRLDRREWPAKVVPLLKKGLKHAEIAKIMGCSISAVTKWALNNGLGRRTTRDDR